MPRRMPSILFVSGFSSSTRAKDLAYEFERYGPLVRCDVPALRNPTMSPYAFVEFRYERDAEDAYYEMHGARVNGSRISVQWAKNPPSSIWRMEPRDRRSPPRDRYRDDYRDDGRDGRRSSRSPRRGDDRDRRGDDRDRRGDDRDGRGGDRDRMDRDRERGDRDERDRKDRDDRGDSDRKGKGRDLDADGDRVMADANGVNGDYDDRRAERNGSKDRVVTPPYDH